MLRPMSQLEFNQARLNAKPYFGPFLACRKSWPHIYWYQQKLIKYLSLSSERDRLSILEIGSWAGASTYSWCEAIARYYDRNGHVTCIDVWDQNIEPVQASPGEKTPAILDVFLHNVEASGYSDLVVHMQSTSDRAFEQLEGQTFDVIYIDGNHSYGHVLNDIVHSIDVLECGGIICGDDLEIQADQISEPVLLTHSEIGTGWAVNPQTGDGYHSGVTRAVAETLGTVSSWHGFWAVKDTEIGWDLIDFESIEAPVPPPLMQYNNEGLKEFDL